MWRVLGIVWGYVWTLSSGVAVLLVVWYVLGRVYERTDVFVVTLCGILYSSTNGLWLGLSLQNRQLSFQLADRTVAIQRLLDPEWLEESDFREAMDRRDADQLHYYIRLTLIGVASLFVMLSCLVRFFAVL